MRNRLYLRIYLALLGSILVLAATFAFMHGVFDPDRIRQSFETFAEVAGEVLPPPDAPRGEQQRALMRLHHKVHAHMALYSAERELIAAVGKPLPLLPASQQASGRIEGRAAIFALRLPDGRWLVAQRRNASRLPVSMFGMLGVVALVIGIAAYPVVRRLTRRLERLQGSVETWGEGQLSTRVAVEGSDEVARLATSFNNSAARIEALVGAQKSLLANASHELRSPLARIRMAVELMQDQASPDIRDELTRNIAELDQLIDEVLLASRLDAMPKDVPADSRLELTGMVAEECAHGGAALEADDVIVAGDARLLRRMVRNLIENARRYGAGSPVTVRLHRDGAVIRLDVCDSGPGVPAEERERIFTPFYRVPGASEAAGGVGLGLSLVRQIARHHHGDVVCMANPPGGSCFRVTLPAA